MQAEDTTVGDACLAAYKRVLDEALRFKAAQLYLLKLQVVAYRDGGVLKEAHDEFVERLKPEYGTPTSYFLERSFILLVAAFELFLQDVLAAIIMVNPKKVGHAEFKLSEILESAGTDELVRRSIEMTLNKLMYKKPNEYLSEIAALLSINDAALSQKWPVFVEAKGRRDLGVHNGWKCNAIYLRKVREAGLAPSFQEGQRTFPPEDGYLDGVRSALTELASSILDGVLEKHQASLGKAHK